MMKERAYDLQERLVDCAVRIIKLSAALPEKKKSDSDALLGNWKFPVGCWILKGME